MSKITPDSFNERLDNIVEGLVTDLPGVCCENDECDGYHPIDDLRALQAKQEAKAAVKQLLSEVIDTSKEVLSTKDSLASDELYCKAREDLRVEQRSIIGLTGEESKT